MKALALICLLLAGCASTPTNSQQAGYTPPEPGFFDYLKGFGELAGEMALGLVSVIADNADSIAGAMGAYSDARSSGASKADAYQAASQSLQGSGSGGYSASGSSSTGGTGANSCRGDTSNLSVGEFNMCAVQDCRAQKGTPVQTRNHSCIACEGPSWTRCHRSSGGVSSAT